MKADIHPDYSDTTIQCACGSIVEVGSTKKDIRVEICSKCHPFFTGKQRFVDTAGRVERFRAKYNYKDGLDKEGCVGKPMFDLELAVFHAQSLGIKEVIILAALGARWDQTLANLLLPAAIHFQDIDIRLVDGQQQVKLIRPNETIAIQGLNTNQSGPPVCIFFYIITGARCGYTTYSSR